LAIVVLAAVRASPISILSDVQEPCIYASVDFSPLIGASDWTGSDGAYTYKFNICRATVSNYYGSDCVTGMQSHQLSGTFCTTNIAGPYTAIWETIEGFGVSLTYNVGGRVCGGTIPSSFTINIECDEDAPATPPMTTYQVSEPTYCAYEITMVSNLSCGALKPSPSSTPSDCQFERFNFSPLALSDDSFYTGNDTVTPDRMYEFNICKPVHSLTCGSSSMGAMAYQYNRTMPDTTCQALGTRYEIEWEYNALNQPQVTYYGGSYCGSLNDYRKTIYVFICSPSYYPLGPHVFYEGPVCTYTISIHTSLAC